MNINTCKSLLLNKQAETWLAAVKQKPKLRFYILFKDKLKAEKYIQSSLSSYERSVLAQIRFGILKLHIETGRFNNTKLEDRLCQICEKNEVEDEIHFLFHCKVYAVERMSWFENIRKDCPHFYYFEPEDQLKYIFNEIPRCTARFIIACLNIRNDKLYTPAL